MGVTCLMSAWSAHEAELRSYLRHRSRLIEEADDLLQEVFIRALRQDAQFCVIENPRAWLFQVARNILADRFRHEHAHVPLPDDIPELVLDEVPTVDALSQCLPRVLSELSADDRLAITFCDIEGNTQQALADAGAAVDAVYHCPHHPKGQLAELAIDCDCRKPAPGMILRAAKDLNLSLADSILVGDKPSDIEAARAAGVGRAYIVQSDNAESTTGLAGADAAHADLQSCVAALLPD